MFCGLNMKHELDASHYSIYKWSLSYVSFQAGMIKTACLLHQGSGCGDIKASSRKTKASLLSHSPSSASLPIPLSPGTLSGHGKVRGLVANTHTHKHKMSHTSTCSHKAPADIKQSSLPCYVFTDQLKSLYLNPLQRAVIDEVHQ